MDVRCEKCQTEYELDESRLKPGGVTVKCTNCGHMFKIRKRSNTNQGFQAAQNDTRNKPISNRQPVTSTSTTVMSPAPVAPEGSPRATTDFDSGPVGEKQWLIRLENGEQKSCRELATLQQWIVAGIVGRESLISRTGKTWKRLGDISELGQYFVIAEEARAHRSVKPTGKPLAQGTQLGVGRAAPGDDDENRSTGSFRARQPTPPPPPVVRAKQPTPAKPLAMAQTELQPQPPSYSAPMASKRPPTQPPPPPRAKAPSADRNTAAWAATDIKASDSMAGMPQGPSGGKLAAIPAEPAFAGRVRVEAPDESSFETGKVRMVDDDDDFLPSRRGSRAGLYIAIVSLIVIAGAATVVYLFAFRDKKEDVAQKPPADAAAVAPKPDATPVVTAIIDAAPPPPSPVDVARNELSGDVEARMKPALDALASNDDQLALRARLTTALAQSMQDRAGLIEKADGDKLRKDAKQLVVDAATLAQKAIKAHADDPAANLAMADVLRLQGKSARDVLRYLDAAKAKADPETTRSIALATAQLLARDGKLDDAQKALAAIDAGGDARVLIASALVAFARGKPTDARPLVDQIMTAQADHETARALQKKLDATVATTDAMPPEDGKGSAKTQTPTPPSGGGGGDYDSLVAKANKMAESNCSKAMELYQKALDQKSQGVEALTGMGYCHLDAKQFASAFSNFRSALVVSPKYEPALGGIAETYQRQGNKEAAIEAWKRYLDVYPNSPKAKKQLELLGGGGGEVPPPPSPPQPVPTPAPAGSGSAG
jgi:predicted Zn finger-like uncharacterized protein